MAGGQIGRVWADIGGDASGLKKAAKEAQDALNKVSGSAQDAGGISTDSLLGIAKAAVAVTAAVKVAKEVFEFGEEGAQIASLEMASRKLAITYGANMDTIVTAVKTASFNTITEYDAMKAANLAMTMGVTSNAEEIANLMQIAIMRGRAFGLTSEEAFERITRGIGRQSIKILDDLGFNIRGASSAQDLFNKVLAEGNKQLDDMGGLIMDVSSPYQRLHTIYGDLIDNVKMSVAYGLLPIFATPEEVNQINQEAAAVELLSGNYQDYINAKFRGGGAYVDKSGLLHAPKADAFTEAQFNAAQALGVTSKEQLNAWAISGMMRDNIEDNTEATHEYNMTLEDQLSITKDLNSIYQKYDEVMAKTKEGSEAATEANEELKDSIKELMFENAINSGMTEEAQKGLARSLGFTNEQADLMGAAMDGLTQKYDYNKNGLIDLEEMTKAYYDDFTALQSAFTDQTATWTLIFRIIGYPAGFLPMPDRSGATGGWGGSTAADILGKMHGGVVYGGQHGMVVPPGFSNDGMPVMVSSGERLEVTPAGNSNKGGGVPVYKFYGDVNLKVDKGAERDFMRNFQQ